MCVVNCQLTLGTHKGIHIEVPNNMTLTNNIYVRIDGVTCLQCLTLFSLFYLDFQDFKSLNKASQLSQDTFVSGWIVKLWFCRYCCCPSDVFLAACKSLKYLQMLSCDFFFII